MNRRLRFRQLISAPGLTVMPGAYDALSARIIEAAGFPAVIAGGYAAIGSMLAQADGGQSNMRDYADHYGRIAEAVSIPLYVDADTGFGGVNNVRQMVRAFENAGVAGLFFSDQTFPNRCGYLPGKSVIDIAPMLAKIHAALDARRDPDLFIGARTDIYSLAGLDVAIERCQRFMDAGCDMAKPQGVDRLDDIARVIREVPGPHIATLSQAAGPNAVDLDDLDRIGVAGVTLPSLTLFAAAKAVRDVMADVFAARSLKPADGRVIALPDYYGIVGLQDQIDRERAADEAGERLAGARR